MKSSATKVGNFFITLTSILISSCSTPQLSTSSNVSQNSIEQGKIVLKFWHGFTGADGDGMQEIVESFNQEHVGEIEVVVDKLSWDALFLKLIQNKTNPKFSPHIVAMGANRVSSMNSRGILRSLDGVEAFLEVNSDDFLPAAWQVGLLDSDVRYSFPLDMHPVGMYYNKDLVTEEELPQTWSEFASLARSKTNSSTGTYGWAIPNMYSITKDVFYSMLLQDGEDILDNSNQAVFNSAGAIARLTEMYDWKYKDTISPLSVGAGGDLTLFQQGKSAFYFDGPWMINTIRETSNIEFGVAPIPESIGEGGTSFSGSHQLTLVKSTVTDERTLEASYTFMEYLSLNSLRWAQAGQVPARLDVHQLDEYKALTDLKAFSEEAFTAKVGKTDYQYFYEAYNYMGSAVSNVLNNVKSPKVALDEKVNQFKLFVNEQ